MSPRELQLVESSGTPREMGRQYGEQAREAIRRNVSLWKIAPEDDAARVAFVKAARETIAAHAPEILEELEGLAEGSGQSLGVILAMNQVNTFGEMPAAGCTSMALAASDDGPVLGKNNDGNPGDEFDFVIRRSAPRSGIGLLQVTYAGWLSGLDAMNAAGLVNGHNSVGSVYDKSGGRLDIRLWALALMRRCETARDFLAGLSRAPLTGKGFNIVVVDSSGQTAVIEAAVPLLATRDLGKPFVFATNHYVTPPLERADRRSASGKEISTYRYGYLRWLEQTAAPGGSDDIRQILARHDPWAPCRHGGPHQSRTLWSMIALPRQGRLLVAPGNPCEQEYRRFDLDDPA